MSFASLGQLQMPRGARPQGGFLGAAPPTTTKAFRGPKDTLSLMAKVVLGDRGEKSQQVRQFVEFVLRYVQPKDYLGECLAIRNCFTQPSPFPAAKGAPLFKYINDPRHVELVKDPQRLVEEINQFGSALCDCDEYAAMAATMFLLIGRKVELVALGFQPGSLSHVGVRVQEPKSERWIWVDGVAGPREREAARTAKELLIWSLD